MHMQKHAYGVWSTDAGRGRTGGRAAVRGGRRRWRSSARLEGPATVATYSVLHGRDGEPERALLVCDVPGRRPVLRRARRRRGGAGGGRGGRADRPDGDADAAGPGERRAGSTEARRCERAGVGGVDGCRGGWVVVTVPARRRAPAADVEVVAGPRWTSSRDLGAGHLAAAAIDIPIGLAAADPARPTWRPAGGSGRGATPSSRRRCAPCSAHAPTPRPAPSRAASAARRLSKQLYNIVAKIREVDALQSPGLQRRLSRCAPS